MSAPEPGWFADTNIVLHVLVGDAMGRHVLDNLKFRARKDAPQISVVTHAELLVLARMRGWGKDKRDRLNELLNELVIVDVSPKPVIDAYADIDVFSRKATPARTMGKNDLWIAAAAVATRSVLLTADKDFDHLSPQVLKVWSFDPAIPGAWTNAPP